MKYWLVVNVVLWGLTYWASLASKTGPSDNFASAVLTLMVGGLGALSTVGYLVSAFWLHRFL